MSIYKQLSERLGSSFEAAQLLEMVTGRTGRDEAVSEEQQIKLEELCRRRLAGEPLQYLLGEWEFYSLPFYVGPGVLIPRPDTEALVDVALELGKTIEHPEVLDLCAGSGCIGIAVAHHLPEASVTAVELSGEAFPYLLRNVERNASRVRAIQADALTYTHPKPVDMILSNPPSIPAGELPTLQAEVQREPAMALDGGTDGLDFYRALTLRSLELLAPGGWLCFEVGIHQSGPVQKNLAALGFTDIGVRKDYGGTPRVVFGRNSPA
ncbi:MAG: peptide chain release factor N(5)-glutamine methyltransferase [Oscillospiraceae bacterium]